MTYDDSEEIDLLVVKKQLLALCSNSAAFFLAVAKQVEEDTELDYLLETQGFIDPIIKEIIKAGKKMGNDEEYNFPFGGY